MIESKMSKVDELAAQDRTNYVITWTLCLHLYAYYYEYFTNM